MRNSNLAFLIMAACIVLAAKSQATEVATSLAAGQSGVIYFNSSNPPTFGSLVRKVSAPTARISGELQFPESTSTRLPAVIIGHGSGGISQEREYAWADFLRSQGYATFVVDSFSARGLSQVATNQSALPFAASVVDLLKALRLLSTHPRIDPDKIAVLGFSRGGFAALYSTIESIRSAVIDSSVKFAAHIPFYPGCAVIGEKYTGSPVQIHLGNDDDYQEVSPCERYVALLKSKGVHAELMMYPGARHGFDRTDLRMIDSRRAETWKLCDVVANVDTGETLRYDTGERLASNAAFIEYYNSCKKYGVRVQGNSASRERARELVRTFLKQAIGP